MILTPNSLCLGTFRADKWHGKQVMYTCEQSSVTDFKEGVWHGRRVVCKTGVDPEVSWFENGKEVVKSDLNESGERRLKTELTATFGKVRSDLRPQVEVKSD